MKRDLSLWIILWLLIGVCSLSAAPSPAQAQTVPFKGENIFTTTPLWRNPVATWREFSHEAHTGQAGQIVGLNVPGLMALSIEVQPQDSPHYVSEQANSATLYSVPLQGGTVWLLAHSHLAGANFDQMNLNQPVILIYGDGRQVSYRVDHIEAYQALEPDNPYSTFLSLDDGSQWSSHALFDHINASGQQVVLQTCLEQGGQPNWGRLFVIASPSLSSAMKALVTAYRNGRI